MAAKSRRKGTHSYNREWNMLDQIILSPNFLNNKELEFVPGSAGIFSPEWIQDTGKYAGQPFRTYAGKKYLGGYADHFPIYIHVRTTGK